MRVKGTVIAGSGQCQRKLELASGAIDLELGIDGIGVRRCRGFFGEKTDSGVFECKVTLGVNGVTNVEVRESK